MSYAEHKKQADTLRPRCAIVTLSDTRTAETNTSGQLIERLLRENDADITSSDLLRDDAGPFREMLTSLIAAPAVDCIITNGGTGISHRDQAIDVVEALLDIPLPGFGELFRMLSFEQIQSGAMLSRAAGGVAGGTLLFALPGSAAAVELAMRRLILPEMRHLLSQIRK